MRLIGQKLALKALVTYGTIRSDKLRRVTGLHKATNRIKEVIADWLLNVIIRPAGQGLVEYTLLSTRHNQRVVKRVLGI
jgi:hypothetical protein